jgi:hypothetical protein
MRTFMSKKIACMLTVGLVLLVCQMASASPIITSGITVGQDVSAVDLSGTIYLAAAGSIAAPNTITVKGVAFGDLLNNPLYLGGTPPGNVANYGGTWGSAPDLGSSADNMALSEVIHYGTYTFGVRWALPVGQTDYKLQIITRNNWDLTDTRTSDLQLEVYGPGDSYMVQANLSSPTGNFISGPDSFGIATFEIPASDATSFVIRAGGNGVVNALILSTPVPEPATMGLLLLGGIGTLLRRRK